MRGHTHALFGVTTMVAANAALHFVQPHVVRDVSTGLVTCAAAAILGGLAPDVDAGDSTIRHELGVAGSLTALGLKAVGVKHRGLTHYGLTTLLVMAVSLVAGRALGYADVGLAFGLGYFSHVAIADAMTQHGVPLWWPLSKRKFHLLPGTFRIRTGGPTEVLVSILVGLLLVWLGWDMLPPDLLKRLGR
jgi:membrane-bound metal-dependent hydrolase YbcI (DUF457 family)